MAVYLPGSDLPLVSTGLSSSPSESGPAGSDLALLPLLFCVSFIQLFSGLKLPTLHLLKLTYNSHTIQFTILKRQIQWFLLHSQGCATTTTI